MRIPISWTVGVALLASLPACSGDDGGGQPCTAVPITLTPGTWCVTLTGTTNTCNNPLDPVPYSMTFTQTGSDVTAVSQYGGTYVGSLCGSSGTMSGTDRSADVVVSLDFPDASHATGTSKWSVPGCSGTDTFTARSGGC